MALTYDDDIAAFESWYERELLATVNTMPFNERETMHIAARIAWLGRSILQDKLERLRRQSCV